MIQPTSKIKMRDRSLATIASCVTFLGIVSSPGDSFAWATAPMRLAQQPLREETFSTNSNPTTLESPINPTTNLNLASVNDLGLGNQGARVKQLQAKLKQLGYFTGEIDGVYGEETKIAVSEFQKNNGLLVDGLVGEATWQSLQSKKSQTGDKVNISAYDRYMESGYQADQQKDYQKALESFQKALKERPNDSYAQDAINKIQGYIDEEDKTLSWNYPWLLLILLSIIAGITGGLLILRSKLSKAKQRLATESFPYQLEATQSKIPQGEENNFQTNPQLLNGNINSTQGKKITSEPETQTVISATTNQGDKNTNNSLTINPTTRLSKVDSVSELIGDLAKPDPQKRRKAIWELAQQADSRAVKPLVELMMDCDSKERGLILEALSQIGTRTIKPLNQALAISLQDDNPEVRKNAIRDLTRVYDLVCQISRLLSHAAEDPDAEVKETARWALQQLNYAAFDRLPRSTPGDFNSENNQDNN